MSRTSQILTASRQVKEQYLKDLLEQMNEGAKIGKRELELIAQLEAEISSGKNEKSDTDFVTDVAGISKFFGVTKRAVQLWAKDGNCPKMSHGMYDLREVHKWWLKNIYVNSGVDSEEIIELRKEDLRWKIDIAKMKAEKIKGQLVSKDEIAKQWALRLAAVSSGLDMLPYQVAPHLEQSDQKTIVKVLSEKLWALKDNFCRSGKFCLPIEGE